MTEYFDPGLMYRILLPLCAVLSLASAYFLLKVDRDNLRTAEKVPRAQIPGAILGLIDLLWCIPNAMPILPESLHKFLLPLAFVLAILAYIALDHLFARAIGGFMILTAHFFLKESYGAPVPGAMIFAIFCFIFGIIGIFISGKPYLIRDIIRLGTGRWRLVMPIFLILFALVSLMTFAFQFTGRN